MAARIRRWILSPNMPNDREHLFGIAAEFASAEDLLKAAHCISARGFTHAEAYTPMPVSGLSEALHFRKTGIPAIVLIAAAVGASGGFFMQWFANVIHLPWNIGGRPINSWPAFIPITFECAILLAGVCGVIGMLALNRLPQPFHPMFRAHDFYRASRDRFFICIESTDPQFDRQTTRRFLEELSPLAVIEVPK
jgi:hypothetical protein